MNPINKNKTHDLNESKINDIVNWIKSLSYEQYFQIFNIAERRGIHILKTGFYSPIPLVDEIDTRNIIDNCHIDWNEKNQLALLEELKQYVSEFEQLVNTNEFVLDNSTFGHSDAPAYYSIIRHFKPQQIIEVGAGYSTKLASIAAAKNPNTVITAIDPYVAQMHNLQLPKSVNFIEQPVQKMPLSFFKKLTNNDILFIDGSHVSKAGSDVNFLFLEVLPILEKGVLIHIHDIFLPKPFPPTWIKNFRLFWNEQYLLHAFLIGNHDFKVILANAFLSYLYPEILQKFYSLKIARGASLWLQKIT